LWKADFDTHTAWVSGQKIPRGSKADDPEIPGRYFGLEFNPRIFQKKITVRITD
jgi:hypothetical protein